MTPPNPNPTNRPDDSGKLLSLMALATGAIAMPQTGSADIIFTDLSSAPEVVGVNGNASFIFDLPGTVQFGFQRFSRTDYTSTFGVQTIYYRTLTAGDLGTFSQATALIQTSGFYVVPLSGGAAWPQGANQALYGVVGFATNSNHSPGSGYNNQYLAFAFRDSTQGGAFRYGWAEVSLNISDAGVTGGGGPTVAIYGYGFDDSGAFPNMGQVPEPRTVGLMVFGALALGARGLRFWRRNRADSSKS